MVQQMQVACDTCSGQGEIFNEKDRCKACKGKKVPLFMDHGVADRNYQVVTDREIIEVHVEKGMEEGENIVFEGKSNQEPGVKTGDVVIVLQEKEHETFKREGMDLIMEMVRAAVPFPSLSLHRCALSHFLVSVF